MVRLVSLSSLVVVDILVAISHSEPIAYSYDRYKQLSVTPNTPEDVEFLKKLESDLWLELQADFWTEPALGEPTIMVVAPDVVRMVTRRLQGLGGMNISVLKQDMQSLVDSGSARTEASEVRNRRAIRGHVMDHYNYHTYSQIQSSIAALARAYPHTLRSGLLPYRTYEGRYVTYIKLTGNHRKRNRSIVVESGIHAREWISPAASLYVIEKLLHNYKLGEATAKMMLDNFDWYFVPVTNPDGYVYSRINRLWRKNRHYFNKYCIGVDLNRNFHAQFATTGVSPYCYSKDFPGTSAFSEPETRNVRDLLRALGTTLQAYVAVHSFGQVVMAPWMYSSTGARPWGHERMDIVGMKMKEALSKPYGTQYEYGTLRSVLNYAASGTSSDWALMVRPGIYAFGFELRPRKGDPRGFLLEASEIVPQGEEFYNSLVALARGINS